VNKLIKDGLKVKNVQVKKADRKAKGKGKAGVVVVTFSSKEDKKAVMDAKKSLVNSEQYSRVYINHDRDYKDRIQEANLRTIISTFGKDKLSMKGNRVVKKGEAGQAARS
jgi:succinyl-CoA synthetase beta subunit